MRNKVFKSAKARRKRVPKDYLGYGLFDLIDKQTGKVLESHITLDVGDLKDPIEAFWELLKDQTAHTYSSFKTDHYVDVNENEPALYLHNVETRKSLYSLEEVPGTVDGEKRRYGSRKKKRVSRAKMQSGEYDLYELKAEYQEQQVDGFEEDFPDNVAHTYQVVSETLEESGFVVNEEDWKDPLNVFSQALGEGEVSFSARRDNYTSPKGDREIILYERETNKPTYSMKFSRK